MTTATPRKISLEITSDTICPFCYVGYKRILSAIDQYNKSEDATPAEFSIRFSPFQLNPALPPSPGLDKMENYHRKFGPDRVKGIIEGMIERGKQVGINFSYGGRISNTVDSHRVLEKAWEKGGEAGHRKVAEAFFRHYFEEEGDIGDHEALAQKVDETGVMSKAETLEFLKSNELRDSVQTGIRKAGMRGITSVPFILINGRVAVSGAQDSETFVEAFKQAAALE